ncbi:efflux RND transporter periplasmic adaptor subunit [Chromatocurvus halotolerans]|uniref:RND family efflux transporter MFP subunit n=1 Tax=Chromatocurvus halotolerans TaxID=1132028 RepID=A0A4R2KZ48_9GAMM|nr:efflux RND transporter periplasmic adaptor subunit [Chromatocurvus halotolerans]TCO78462.1 RND family efflux transporter MFP subunit [Chromatocurvus halotolerans]
MKRQFPALLRPLAILAGAGAIAVFMLSSRETPVARSIDQPLPLVQAQTIRKTDLPVTLVAHGNVRAWRELELTAEVTGRVLWASERFEPGMEVAEGELLLRIDATDYELALAEAQQSLASAELTLADARALSQKARVNEAQATVVAARARIARARRDLDNTEILAPYNAVIDTALVEVGQFISAGTEVGRILGSDKAEVRLPLLQRDVLLIDGAGEVAVTLSSGSGTRQLRWTGRVARIESRIDSETRVIPVVVEVPEPLNTERHATPLPFGLFVRAEIAGKSLADAVRIPQSALHGDSDVFVFEDGRLQRRTVDVERLRDGLALITSGLDDGDRVVTTRLDLMFEGMAVDLADE